MKIEYRTGDLFSTDIVHIAHGCNAQGVMGSGVARIVRDRYPEAYEYYRIEHEKLGLTMGTARMIESNGKVIINAVTQENFGPAGTRWVSYDAVADAFRSIERVLSGQADQVALPRIGAGLGGGDWDVIAAIIESELKTVQPVVYTP